MTATVIPANEDPFAETISLSPAHEKLRLMMAEQLAQSFIDCLGTVPVTAVDEQGNLLGSFRPPISKEMPPISDLDLATLVFHELEQLPKTKGRTAAFAFVRFDVPAPEIIVTSLNTQLVEVLRTPRSNNGPAWTGQLLSHPDATPRGGSVGSLPTSPEIKNDGDIEDLAEDVASALNEISVTMFEKTAQLAADANNVTEIPETALYDGDSYWVYCALDLPGNLPTLKSSVQAAAEIARNLPSAVTAIRFRHKNSIYILALYCQTGGEIGQQIKAKFLRPGVLGAAKTFDAAPYLDSSGR